MLRIRRFRVVGVVAASGVVGAIGGAAIGQTAQASGDLCSSGQVCIFEDANYVGELGWLAGGQELHEVSSGANDQMSSWQNRTSWNARWYTNAYGRGTCEDMPHNTWRPQAQVNDALSSWATNGPC